MVKRIEALGRGLSVLDLLDSTGPIGLSELSRRSGLSKATLLRVLHTLERAGYARKRLADRCWQATLRSQGAVGDRHMLLAEVAGPVLDALCQRVLWPSDVGVFDDGAIRVLETSRRLSPFLINRDVIAQRIHVTPSAMGRAILAWSSPEARARILRDLIRRNEVQERAAQDQGSVAELVSRSRERGYAVRHAGYFVSAPREAQVTAIAVPVMVSGEPAAAINLSWVASAMSEADFASRHLTDLSAAAAEISARIETAGPG